MPEKPDDLERLVYESLEQLGYDANPKDVANRVKRLNIGLPIEDEFSVLCGWLGQCEIVHKLDQQQYPKESNKNYQVPDLFAVFSVGDSKISVCIEVKSSNKNVLSFTPEYREKILRYSEAMGHPVLIAWKHSGFGMWCLFPISIMKKANKNFNISFFEAQKENILGVLAGDFSYSVDVGTGLHIRFKKVELVSVKDSGDGREEQWKMVIDKVYYTNSEGNEINDLSSSAQNAFVTLNLEEDETHTDTHIIKHFTCKEPHGVFAHMALVNILSFGLRDGKNIHWRNHIGDQSRIDNIKGYREGIEECMRKGVVRLVLHQIPNTMPSFIEKYEYNKSN